MNPLYDEVSHYHFLSKLLEQPILPWPAPVLPLPPPPKNLPTEFKGLFDYAAADALFTNSAFKALVNQVVEEDAFFPAAGYDQMALDQANDWSFVGLLAAEPMPDDDGCYVAELLSPFLYKVRWDTDLLCDGTIPAAGEYLWPLVTHDGEWPGPPWGVGYFADAVADYPVHWQPWGERATPEFGADSVAVQLFIDAKVAQWVAA